MSNDKVYVVMGQVGEYSDYVTWPVMAFFDEKQAQEYVISADARAGEWCALNEATNQSKKTLTPPEDWNQYDPEFHERYKCWRTYVSYYYLTAPINNPRKGEEGGSDK